MKICFLKLLDRHIELQIDRRIDKEIVSWLEGWKFGQIDEKLDIQLDRQWYRQLDIQIVSWIDSWENRLIEIWIDSWIDRQIGKLDSSNLQNQSAINFLKRIRTESFFDKKQIFELHILLQIKKGGNKFYFSPQLVVLIFVTLL